MTTKNVNGEQVELTADEEIELIAEKAAYDPSSELRLQLIAMERQTETEALITAAMAPKLAQIHNMNATALRAALAAGGLS